VTNEERDITLLRLTLKVIVADLFEQAELFRLKLSSFSEGQASEIATPLAANFSTCCRR
jgi:hypothetical protein